MPVAPQPGQLRVLTYNTHHGANRSGRLNLPAIADTVARLGPDVVALREVDRHWSSRSDGVDEPAWYAERLGLEVSFAAVVVGTAVGGRPSPEYGLAVLSRFPIEASTRHLYAGTAGEDVEPRGLQQVLLRVPGPGAARSLRLVNTHLSVADGRLRRREVEELLGHGGGTEVPTVLAGDFNATPRSAEISAIRASYRDAWEAGSGRAATIRARRIDYLFLSSQLRPVRTAVVRSPASDHCAVVCDLAWP